MNQRSFISRFSPNRTDPEVLEQINVQREQLLATTLERLRESALSANKHHLLFVGPRGCGKTHLLTLIVHRIRQQSDLSDCIRIAWLNEDETSLSFLDLLVRVYRALGDRYPAEFPPETLQALYGQEPETARAALEETLVHAANRRAILVLIENLDGLFEQLDEGEQRRWRAFIQNHSLFATVATAQRLFAGVSDRDQPFFGFFDTYHLKPLTVAEAQELLVRMAHLAGRNQLVEFLGTARGRARVHAIHHLSGGNHRLYIVLSEFLTRETLDDLVLPFEQMVDEQLTPYFQERLRWLSPQQRKIVELLCQRTQPIPVKSIAEQLFATHASITNQLKQLREMGYVVAHPRGREVLYEPAELLMRLSMQVKATHEHEPLRLIVDFLRVWYERQELEHQAAHLEAASRVRDYFEAALAGTRPDDPSLCVELLRGALAGVDWTKCEKTQVEEACLLAQESGESADVMRAGIACFFAGDLPQAAGFLERVIATPSISAARLAEAQYLLGSAHASSGRLEDGIRLFTAVLDNEQAPAAIAAGAVFNRGTANRQIGRLEDALADFTRVAAWKDAPTGLVQQATFCRGELLREAGKFAEAKSAFSQLIDSTDTPEDLLVRALLERGVCRLAQADVDGALADSREASKQEHGSTVWHKAAALTHALFCLLSGKVDAALSSLAGFFTDKSADPQLVACARVVQGKAFLAAGRTSEALSELQTWTGPGEEPEPFADLRLCGLIQALFDAGRWDQMLEHVAGCARMSEVLKIAGPDFGDTFVRAVFRQITNEATMSQRAAQTVEFFATNNIVDRLGNALVRHLPELGASPLNETGLRQWLECWRAASGDHEAMQVPLRLLSAGVDYLRSHDQGVLLQLPQEERSLARTALGLEKE